MNVYQYCSILQRAIGQWTGRRMHGEQLAKRFS